MKKYNILLFFVLSFIYGQVGADSRLIATGGINNVEGSAGGGIIPWSVISGYSSSDEWSFTTNVSRVDIDDFQLDNLNFSVSYNNRFELSYAQQDLDVHPLNLNIKQEIIGAKVRLYGDVLYTDMPQISLGVAHKSNKHPDVPFLLGAGDDSGTDYYVSAAKVFLNGPGGYNWLTNLNLRYTDANQNGLLGFGRAGADTKTWVTEAAVAFLPTESVAVGVEYRQQPESLNSVKEDAWKDFFVAWFINKNVSVTAAYVDLGSIAGLPDQTGYYINFQGYF